jgi:hypothetical protein
MLLISAACAFLALYFELLASFRLSAPMFGAEVGVFTGPEVAEEF